MIKHVYQAVVVLKDLISYQDINEKILKAVHVRTACIGAYTYDGNTLTMYVMKTDHVHDQYVSIEMEISDDDVSGINDVVEHVQIYNCNILNQKLIEENLNKKHQYSTLHINDGIVTIISDGDITILQDEYNLAINTKDHTDGLATIERTDVLRNGVVEDNNTKEFVDTFKEQMTEEEIQETLTNIQSIFDEMLADINPFQRVDSNEQLSAKHEKDRKEFTDLLQSLDDIDNGREVTPSEQKLEEMTNNERNVKLMKDLLINVREVDGFSTTMAQAVKGEKSNIELSLPKMKELITEVRSIDGDTSFGKTLRENFVNPQAEEQEAKQETEVLTDSDVEFITKEHKTFETIEVYQAVISYDKFDEYASKHNIIGWDLTTPSTLQIKFIEGVTPESQVQKFHDMMDKLDAGWVSAQKIVSLDNTKFLSELNTIFEADLAEEFVRRVNKHNIFVRETMSKIRAALVDMEFDFNKTLSDEVNLSIDWEGLTAYAAKKERTQHRVKGVQYGSETSGSITHKAGNLVKINTGLVYGDFYIPISLLSDEIRSKYVIDADTYYIDDVPEYPFYEVIANGHYILIEKTDF